ncbi:MAG: pseudouridine-5'-phosphate glycosidase [Saprospiraceae bacterium]
MVNKNYLEFSKEVTEAIDNQQPIVALESTIISHGMPYPQNVETARRVEACVRENGAVPATIAILNGKLKVGLSASELEYLGKKGREVIKCSRRDLPFVVAKGLDGATTVASTMIIAAMAGIKVFATGGIGGVHRGAERTMDISADLQELARTNVAVVCAGAKSILDLPLTLEYLETHGVPVIGFQTPDFPAFYTRKSGLKVDYQVDSARELAAAIQTKWALGLQGGVVIANPIPDEYSMNENVINEIIDKALQKADSQHVTGKDVTPFLLAKIEALTGGNSLKANIQLVLNNAKLAALVAQELY